MSLSLKCIATILILAIAKLSRCDIPECKYEETIDISDYNKFNDTFVNEDLEIPANLTGEYHFRVLQDGTKEWVSKHLRACICKVRPCIRICCARKNVLPNGECNDGLQKEISLRILNLTFDDIITLDPNITELRKMPQYNHTKLIVLREYFQPCDELIGLKTDEYTMLKDGSILLHSTAEILSNDQYCLFPHTYSDFPKILWFVNRMCATRYVPGTFDITIISLICLILTITVYLYVKKLRNLLGKCLISCLFCMTMDYLIWTLNHLSLLYSICTLVGYSKYFFSMASYLWSAVISYYLRKLFTSLNRHEPRNAFKKYSAFVWGTAAVPTGIIYLMNQISGDDPQKRFIAPFVGVIRCTIQDWGSSNWIFFNVPILILTTFSSIMFVLTAIHIWKVKREVKRFAQQNERSRPSLDIDIQTYLQFLRLFVIMGVFWILDKIMGMVEDFHYLLGTIYLDIPVYLNSGFGIIIFVILILKGSTLELLMNR
ncbi:probable G-protein coupled receptor Mth-like 12 [Drosophila biarmipes]|uniref:probable G-protein coupled receptor Mth-like 12 n=1 Tax=Drosophila biarmipes TaxID=125945 RepID=UPI001CDA68DF|nr:probable G-protein coupled receptor Mth-like 12 [Drosophila biarmipes]